MRRPLCALLTHLIALGAIWVTESRAAPADELFDPATSVIVENFLATTMIPLPGKQREPVVHEWTAPVQVSVLGDPTEFGLESLNLHLHHVKALTQLEIAAAEDGNLFIAFVNDPKQAALGPYRRLTRQFFPTDAAMEERVAQLAMDRNFCFSFIGFRGDTIAAAAVFVQRDREPELIHACLVREVTRIIGLMGEIRGLAYSAFASKSVWIDLTRQDEEFLRLLYNPRLQPGVTSAEARRIVQELIAVKPAKP